MSIIALKIFKLIITIDRILPMPLIMVIEMSGVQFV